MADEPLPEHRVAITVFATARGGDAIDAAMVAQRALRQAFALAAGDERRVALPLDVPVNLPSGTGTVQIVGVRETGAAARNGYLWVEPTAESWRDADSARRVREGSPDHG